MFIVDEELPVTFIIVRGGNNLPVAHAVIITRSPCEYASPLRVEQFGISRVQVLTGVNVEDSAYESLFVGHVLQKYDIHMKSNMLVVIKQHVVLNVVHVWLEVLIELYSSSI